MRVYRSLFRYDSIEEVNGNLYFSNVKLHKTFPDENFTIGSDQIFVIMNPIEGTLCIHKEDSFEKSVFVKIKTWLDSDGLCRTDSRM